MLMLTSLEDRLVQYICLVPSLSLVNDLFSQPYCRLARQALHWPRSVARGIEEQCQVERPIGLVPK